MNNLFSRTLNILFTSARSKMNRSESFVQKIAILMARMNVRTKQAMAEKLGISRTQLYLLESGEKEPSPLVLAKINEYEQSAGIKRGRVQADPLPYLTKAPKPDKRIPVVSWAHAGHAMAYEEMAFDDVEWVVTDCPDPKAFALRLVGDSMADEFREGDLLILQPSEQAHSGCLAVVRLASDGVVFRRIEIRQDRFQLVPLNKRYEPEEITPDKVSWIYPLWGMFRQTWK